MRTFLKTFVAIGAVLAWSGSALAGLNINITGNTGPGNSYNPGDVLNVVLTGDSEGLTAPIIRALLTVDPSLVPASGTAGTLNSSTNAAFFWAQTGVVGSCGGGGLTANQCVAVDAYEYVTFGGVSINLTPSTLSTWSFNTAGSSGDLLFVLAGDGAGFFGLPQTTLTLTQVPEPGTAGLLGLGLVSLAFAGRRRR